MFYILVTFLDTTAQERREAGKMLVLYKEIRVQGPHAAS